MLTLVLGLSLTWSPFGVNLECKNPQDKAGFFFTYSGLSISLGAHEFARHKAQKTPLESTASGSSFYILENDNYLIFEYIQNTVRERWRMPSGQVQTWTKQMWDEAYKRKYIIRYHSMFKALYGLALNKQTLDFKRYDYSLWPATKITPTKWVWLKTNPNKKFPFDHEWQKLSWPQPTDQEQQEIWPDEKQGSQNYEKIKNITSADQRWAQIGGTPYQCTHRYHPLHTSVWKDIFK